MPKTALIGLDGLSWRVVLSYAESFRDLLKLARNGIRGISWAIPPYTPPSWTSISTGTDAYKHGILGFSLPDFREHRSRYLSSYDIPYPRISEMLAMMGLSSLVINHPISYPPSGWYLKRQALIYDDTSPKEFAYPTSLERYLKFFRRSPKCRPSYTDREWITCMSERILRKIEGTIKLIEEINPDFLWVMFKEPDTLMHYLQFIAAGEYDEGAFSIFSAIDESIRDISTRFDNILIVSDHGFDVYLRRINSLAILSKASLIFPPDSMNKIISELLSTKLSGLLTWSLLRSRLGHRIFYLIRQSLRRGGGDSHSPKSITLDEIDGDNSFLLYFEDNLLRSMAIKALSPYLGTLFESIKPLEIKKTKALLLVPLKGLHFMNDYSLRGSVELRFAASRHSPAGMFVFYGPQTNPEVKEVMNFDIAPTILSSFNLPVAQHFDGKDLTGKSTCSFDYLAEWRKRRKLYRIISRTLSFRKSKG